MVLQLCGLDEGLTTPHRNELFKKASDLDRCFETMQAIEYGHEIWKVECEKSVGNSCNRISEVGIRVNGSTGGQMGQGRHVKCRGLYFCIWKRK
jgi:hypothetical protein